MNRIRSSEKPIRHSGNRDDIGRRGGIQKIYLGKDVIDYQHLNPRVREDVAQALTQAEVVRAQKEVWDRARFISELGKIAVEQLEGLIGFDNLDDIVKNVINNANDAIESTILKLNSDPRSETQFSSIKQTAQEIDSVVIKLSGNPDDPQQFSAIKQTAEAIDSVVATLNKSPDDPSQFSSIKQTAQEINSMVSKLSGNPDDPQQFSAIKQTAEAIDSVVATLNKNPDDPSQFSSIKQTSQDIENIVATLNSDPEDAGQFSSIRQTASQISQVVSKLNSDPNAADQYSAIRQTAQEIDLRVRKDQVISSINLSPEEIRISGNRVSIDADTLIARKVILAENLDIGRIPSSLPEGGTLFHFDHSLLSTRGLRPLPGSVATLRPGEGRFGGAVAVEEGTTNELREDVRRCTGGWGNWGPDTGSYTLQFGADGEDKAVITVTQDLTRNNRIVASADLVASNFSGATCTFQLEVEVSGLKSGSMYLAIEDNQGSGWNVTTSQQITADGKYRLTVTRAMRTNLTGIILDFWFMANAGTTITIRRAQFEKKPFATSWVNGTRAGGALKIPTAGVLNTIRGTVAAWINTPLARTGHNLDRAVLLSDWHGLSAATNVSFFWYVTWDGKLAFAATNVPTIITATGKVPSNTWTHVAVTWDNGAYKLYVNGVLEAQGAGASLLNPFSSTISIGSYDFSWGLYAHYLNGLLDELLILPYAASDEEIRAWYELGSPFYDAAEITVGGRGAVVINEEGAFGYSSNGVKRAGFSTDGKWVAGGRADGTFAVEADEAGLRVTAPGGEVRFNTDTNGNVFVAGELRPSILILPVRES